MSDVGAANQHKGNCKAVVSGLLCGKPMRWEVVFDIEPFLNGREREEKVHEELWNETFHHLAGRSIIQDFEHMVEKECEIEHGQFCVDLCFIKRLLRRIVVDDFVLIIIHRLWQEVPTLCHSHQQSLQYTQQIHSVCSHRSGH